MICDLSLRMVARIRRQDPEGDAFRRAVRAAISVALVAGVSQIVIGSSQTRLFTLLGKA
jgi:hypothetical protein